MKNFLCLTLMALAVCQIAEARAPQPVNPPADLPPGITVSPSQGFIDISNNASPQGASSIGLTFTQEVMPNPNNTQPAVLYYNDFESPAEKTLVATVDQATWKTVGVIFKERTWTLSGVYKVEIPEGMFVYVSGQDAEGERTGTAHTPAVTLYYEIYRGYVVTPGSGTFPEISKSVLTFTDADEVKRTSLASEIQFYMDNSSDVYGYGCSITDNDGDGRVNDVVFTYGVDGEPVTAPGIYGLNIPAGAFKFVVYGESHDSDPSDYVEYENNEILVKYTIPVGPQPEIDPDPNFKVNSFDEFLLYLPDGFELFFPDTMGHSPLYGVDENGNVDTTRIYAYAKADFPEAGSGFVTLRLYDPLTHELLEEYVPPVSGMYCLRTVPSLLYGTWSAALTGGAAYTGGSASYDYFYTVDVLTGVDTIEAANDTPAGVYNLYGMKVAEHIGDLNRLPKGIYICGSKKVLVK